MKGRRKDHPRIVVIGAGVGGLTAAAVLARAGLEVTVLEAQVYPGGCAATYFHQGYRFDSGATLAGGFYPGGPMDKVASAAGLSGWHGRPANPPMIVHLPDGTPITVTGGQNRWERRLEAFGPSAKKFFLWQERTADVLWELALRLPSWPPQSPGDLPGLLRGGLHLLDKPFSPARLAALARDAFRPVAAHLKGAPDRLRLFADAQLLISAQALSDSANALYGAAALDLPRRGVVHLEGGMGAIAQTLSDAVHRNGGKVRFRSRVQRIRMEQGRPVAVELERGEPIPAEIVIANLLPENIAGLMGEEASGRLRRKEALQPEDGWGAFVVYAGIDGSVVPEGSPLHHQVVWREPLGEGNSVFLSLSPAWDVSRAPEGRRALTLSTHTRLEPWLALYSQDREAYAERKAQYAQRILEVAEIALPGLRQAADLVLPGTPVTFQRFTGRARGWVGGFPQTSLLRAWGPRLGPGLWMVGDSIFPGQSTAAVALGGLRLAQGILGECEIAFPFAQEVSWATKA